jgi:beta-lactamase regulating signal transducer with metallopeptidase domain
MMAEEANEIAQTAAAAKHHKDNANAPEPADKSHWEATAIGVGVGVIGSAALAAALLYANRDRGKRKK